MNKRLITIITPEIEAHCNEIAENHGKYAAKNGYDYRKVTEKHWHDLHPSFSKVWEIYSALREGVDFVLWADADVAFMDHRNDLMKLLEPDYFMAAYHQSNWPNWTYLCAGLTVWRNTESARRYTTEWLRRCESKMVTYAPWEQWFMDELTRETNYAGIRACSGHEIGCFCPEIWHDGTIWKPGMPTVHFGGQATWETRRRIFMDNYRQLVIYE